MRGTPGIKSYNTATTYWYCTINSNIATVLPSARPWVTLVNCVFWVVCKSHLVLKLKPWGVCVCVGSSEGEQQLSRKMNKTMVVGTGAAMKTEAFILVGTTTAVYIKLCMRYSVCCLRAAFVFSGACPFLWLFLFFWHWKEKVSRPRRACVSWHLERYQGGGLAHELLLDWCTARWGAEEASIGSDYDFFFFFPSFFCCCCLGGITRSWSRLKWPRASPL